MRYFVKTNRKGKIIKNNFNNWVTKSLNPFNMEKYKEITEKESKVFDNLDGRVPYWKIDKIVLKSVCDKYVRNSKTGEIKICSMLEGQACEDGFEIVEKHAYDAWILSIKKEGLEKIIQNAGEKLIKNNFVERSRIVEKICTANTDLELQENKQALISLIGLGKKISENIDQQVQALKNKSTMADLDVYQIEKVPKIEEILVG